MSPGDEDYSIGRGSVNPCIRTVYKLLFNLTHLFCFDLLGSRHNILSFDQNGVCNTIRAHLGLKELQEGIDDIMTAHEAHLFCFDLLGSRHNILSFDQNGLCNTIRADLGLKELQEGIDDFITAHEAQENQVYRRGKPKHTS